MERRGRLSPAEAANLTAHHFRVERAIFASLEGFVILSPEQRAAAVAAQLVEAGFPAFTRRHPDGVSHQVIVGPYASPEEGAAAQRALEAQGVTGTNVRLETRTLGGR